MEYATAAPHHAAAPAPAPAADPHHTHLYSYPYPYAAYHQPAPTAADPSAAAAAAAAPYYYHNPAATAASSAVAPYDPYAAYQYYASQPGVGAGGGAGLAGYYFSAGETSQAPAALAPQAAPAGATGAAGKEAGKHFGFDPQLYAQVAAARASNGMAPPVATPSMHHAQWNAHFGHPVPKNVLRNHIKKKPKVVQPATCEVCKIQCDTLDVLKIHKQGKKHKKNLEKLQDSITPKQAKPPNVGANAPPAAVVSCMVSTVQSKKKKSASATPEELEVKKRRVLEAGAAQGEVKICTVCNVVVNSQKVYEFHLAGQKHQAMVQKQRAHYV